MWPNVIKNFENLDEFPAFRRMQVTYPRPRLADVSQALHEALSAYPLQASQLLGKRVAITAGSRGISEIATILAALVAYLRARGAEPFIIPAMGSHGGATADGQRSMLAALGMTEDKLNAPIRSSLDTVELGKLPNGMPVFIDRLAAEADAIVIVNRVKPHTDFIGDYESGLAKMTAIGMGKLRGADILHRYGVQGLLELMPEAARFICEKAPVLFGLAIVENAYHEVAKIAVVPPGGVAGAQEAELLKLAYQLMPYFPFPEIDVLVVDEIGKNISGVGMDPKVIGRVKVHGVPDLAACSIRTIVALRLTPEAHGNASGIGLADITTQRLVEGIDFEATYLNCITSGITGIQRASLPLVAPSDKAAIQTALRVCGRAGIREAKVVRVKNTLSLDRMHVSVGLIDDVNSEIPYEISEKVFYPEFDAHGNLVPLE